MKIFGIPILAAVAVAFVLVVLVVLGYTRFSPVAGFGVTRVEWDDDGVKYRARKTLWDWFELLGPWSITLAAALLAAQFSAQIQRDTQRAEEQRADAAAVQAYLDQMGTLLLEPDLRDDDVNTLLQARTLAVLESLAPELETSSRHKRTIMRFLYEASLVDKDEAEVLQLGDADLRDADLRYTILADGLLPLVHLNHANLSNAFLEDADLGGANLEDANLEDANLSNASMNDVDLSGARLVGANLDSTYLKGADLRDANLADANLSGAFLKGADMTGARLSDANLSGATLPDEDPHTGTYVTEEFATLNGLGATLSFEIGKGWKRGPSLVASTRELSLEGPEGGQLIFTSPDHVWNPSKLSDLRDAPVPENAEGLVSWFQDHPNLCTPKKLDATNPCTPKRDTLKQGKINVGKGSAPKEYLEVTYCIHENNCSKPENPRLEPCIGRDCVPLFPVDDPASYLASYAGDKDGFVITYVNGTPVVMNISASADKFDTFLPKARKVLRTVRWEDSGTP